MWNLGYKFFRYVDDIRVFCTSKNHAFSALADLAIALRPRGLNLQSAKSRHYTKDSAKPIIQGVGPQIAELRHKYVRDFLDEAGMSNYMSFKEAEQVLMGADGEDAPVALLREAYERHILSEPGDFERSMFRFLLIRLGRARDQFAVTHCLTLLRSRPEETEAILKYLNDVHDLHDIEAEILTFMKSDDAIYEYQTYQILESIAENAESISPELLKFCRLLAFDRGHAFFLCSAARRLLALFGTSADLERIHSSYSEATPMEQCEVICCLRRLELVKRNGFLARARSDGPLHELAADLIMKGKS
jgi:hypothetical protein